MEVGGGAAEGREGGGSTFGKFVRFWKSIASHTPFCLRPPSPHVLASARAHGPYCVNRSVTGPGSVSEGRHGGGPPLPPPLRPVVQHPIAVEMSEAQYTQPPPDYSRPGAKPDQAPLLPEHHHPAKSKRQHGQRVPDAWLDDDDGEQGGSPAGHWQREDMPTVSQSSIEIRNAFIRKVRPFVDFEAGD